MTTVLDLLADAAPTADDMVYVVNDPAGTPGNRKVTIGNLATLIGTLLGGGAYVTTGGAQNITGVKTFTVDPIVPDEVYGVAWNGSLEPPTKNAVYDKIETLPTLDTTTPLALSVYTLGNITFVDWIGSGGGGGSVFSDAVFKLQDNIDTSKQLQFQLASITTATTQTLTVPDLSGTLALTTGSQTLTSKILGFATLFSPNQTLTSLPIFADLQAYGLTTLDFANAYRHGSVWDAGNTVFNQTAIALGLTADTSFEAMRTIKNASGSALTLGNLRPFTDHWMVQADTAAVTVTAYSSFLAGRLGVGIGSPTSNFSVTGGGTLLISTLSAFNVGHSIGTGVTVTTYNVHASAPTVPGGAVGTVAHYKANNIAPSGGGSVDTMYGLSIDALTGATTLNMGIRNAAGEQQVSTARTIAAVGDSLVSTSKVLARRYELTNSSGGSLTLTSAPTLPDGVDGQVVKFVNVGAQNIVIQDQGSLASSNLRLGAASRTLGPRDSIQLSWSTGIGDWIEDWFSNVV